VPAKSSPRATIPLSGQENSSQSTSYAKNGDEKLNRIPQLFDEILLLLNGRTHAEINNALAQVRKALDTQPLNYSINRYTP
jgi:hypothetical protein